MQKRIIGYLLSFTILISSALLCCPLISKSVTYTTGYVNADIVNVREDAGTSYKSLDKVSFIYVTVLGSKKGTDGNTWYNITYSSSDRTITGYISGLYLKLITYDTDSTFEQQLENFPSSYHTALRTLHAQYPNWVFYADNVDLTLYEAVELQNSSRRKQVQMSNNSSWKSMGPDAYDWSKGSWISDNGSWCSASRELIAYYMDPRNFINNNYIYTYVLQNYDAAAQTENGIKTIIKGTFLENGYSDSQDTAYGGSYVKVIMEAARQSGVSPYMIASTILQEQGTRGTSSLISGTTKYGKYYNFFNVSASGSTNDLIIQNGLNYARDHGWTTRSAAIIGGAKFAGKDYLDGGQNTYFYMNYNVNNPNRIWKQYAQAVHNAASSGYQIAKAYANDTNARLTFRIPVYKNMTDSIAYCPPNNDTLNNYYFSSISVSGLTPTFSMYQYSYDLKVNGNTQVNVTVPSKATVTSPSTFSLSAGNNSVVLSVKSESGYYTYYTINVNASRACTLSISKGSGSTVDVTPSTPPTTTVMRGDTNGDGKISLIDLANIQKHLLGIKALTGNNFLGADTNNDGKISLIDLANVQKHLLGVKALSQ